jgi:tetratricopeptide (TPR) repeat protein
MMRRVRLLMLCTFLGACATPATGPTATGPKATAPVSPIKSEEDYAANRAEFDALDAGAPDRPQRRAALQGFLLGRVNRALDGKHLEDAWDELKQALTLFDADELSKKVQDPALLAAAERFERAVRPRGAHQLVLAALAVQQALGQNDAPSRFRQVTAWLRNAADGTDGDGRERVVEDLETVVKLWPSPFVVGELTTMYLEPSTPNEQAQNMARKLRRGADLRDLLGGGAHPNTAYDIARLYLRISQPKQALDNLSKLPGEGDPKLKTLLTRHLSDKAMPGDVIELAKYFAGQGRDDRDVSARICRDAARRFPAAPEPRLCAGELAFTLDQLMVALRNFEEAVRLEPGRHEAWVALAKLYQKRLFQLVSDENLNVSELEKQLAKVETFYADAQKRFPDKPLTPSMAGALFEVGRGYYNVGRLPEAVKYLERSISMEASSPALEQLGQIRLKKGQGREAAALFEKAISVPKESRVEELYWRAKLRRELADAFESLDDAHGAEAARKAALADWDVFLGFPVDGKFVAEAWTEKAKLLYTLGEREDAIAACEKAIDAVPDLGNTYADVIAFLVPRGELEEALDAYHRALGRSEVIDYLKVYCSLWILDLAKRAGQPEDPLATAYLQSTDGAKWYDDLARWATARQSEDKLLARADSPARKAESSFYRAMRAWSDGKKDDAKRLWQEVLSTDMMAFFEYDMAAYYLKRGGAPSQPVLKPAKPGAPVKRSQPHPQQQPTSPRPDGSI